MHFAYLATVLGLSVWFIPSGYRPAVLVLVLACGVLYVRAMNRRGQAETDKALEQAEEVDAR